MVCLRGGLRPPAGGILGLCRVWRACEARPYGKYYRGVPVGAACGRPPGEFSVFAGLAGVQSTPLWDVLSMTCL